MLDLLLKLFPLTSMWLQVATWVWIRSWLYSPLMSSLSSAHLFTIVLKLLWGQSYFTAEASTTLSLAILYFFKCYKTKLLHVWSLPSRKTKLLSKTFVLQFITVFRSSHQSCTVKKSLLKIWEISHENTCARVSF